MICVITSIVLMTIDQRYTHLDPLRRSLATVIYPLQYLVDLPSRAGSWSTHTLVTRKRLIEENQNLRARQLLFNARLQKLTALEHENIRLRGLLKSATHLRRDRVLVAELLSVDLDPYRQRIVINKGARHGAFVGQPLLDAHGVMGQITQVNPLNSAAILISDPSHALPVQVNRNGLRLLAYGTGNPQVLSLRHVSVNADVRVGDVVSTSGLAGRYPPDYPVGTITRVHRQPGEPFTTVEAVPISHLDSSREVLLVWTPKPKTRTKAAPAPAQAPTAAAP